MRASDDPGPPAAGAPVRRSGSAGTHARLGRAVGSVAGVGLALWGVAWILAATTPAWHLYRASLGETLGHRLAGKLAACRAAGAAGVLIVGASSAREGFDERVLRASYPAWTFCNAGLAAGSVDTLAVTDLMLRKSGARPGVLVAAVHPFMLRHMDQEVVPRGYADFFDLTDGGALLALQFPGPGFVAARRALWLNTLWPPYRHARLLGRYLRAGLHHAHRALYWGTLRPAEAFQVVPGDTRPMAEYRFQGIGEGLEPMIRRWRAMGFLDERTYAGTGTADALDGLLRSFAGHAGRLVVVVMPEHSYLRERAGLFNQLGFRDRLAAVRERGALLLDYRALLPDDEFLDLGHASAAGRARLSGALADGLVPVLGRRSRGGGEP